MSGRYDHRYPHKSICVLICMHINRRFNQRPALQLKLINVASINETNKLSSNNRRQQQQNAIKPKK